MVSQLYKTICLHFFRKIELASRHINERVQKGRIYEDAWNETSIELVAAAEAHCRAFMVETYYGVMKKINNISEPLRKVLNDLMELYAVHVALRCTGDLLRVLCFFC